LFVLAFGAIIPQHDFIFGSERLLPVRVQLARIRRDYPGPRRFLAYPTLLWLNDSDAMLRGMAYAGVLCGALAIYGGPLGYFGIALGYVLWVSLELRGFLFPWDTLLQEASFLALFMPLTEPLPSLLATEPALPSVAFVFRWLVLRLMIGFGKDKFVGSTKADTLYLRGFFVWMPLPSPLGWLGHHAPRWLLRASLYFMFFAELIAPVLGLWTGMPRLISYASLVGLMIGIGVTGSWGYFNWGYILLCTCLLDVNASLFDLGREPWASRFFHWPDIGIHSAMLIMFLVSLIYLPTNSWFSRAWPAYPVDLFAVPRRWRALVARIHRIVTPARWFAALRNVNGYGVFPPNSMAPVRMQPVLEGSLDGVTWKQYGYKHIPAFKHSRPPYIAPYHARLDQWTFYISQGVDTCSLFGGILPTGNPYTAGTRFGLFDLIMHCIMRGDRRILAGLGHNPFPNDPPKHMRLALIALTPSTIAELRATGNWWHTRRLGLVSPARSIDDAPAKLFIPEPELFSPEFVAAKRAARPLQLIIQAYQSGIKANSAVIVGSDLTAADVERFWNEFVPFIAQDRGDWTKVHERGAAVSRGYSIYELHSFERIFERFAWLLMLRTEPHHWGDAQPELPPLSRYRFHKLMHEVILDGEAAYQAVLEQPANIVERAQTSTHATQLWALAMLRYEALMGFNLILRTQDIVRMAHAWEMPGFFEYYPVLAAISPPGEEPWSTPVLHENGEHTIEGFYPASRFPDKAVADANE
jgi:hypothetical protein